MLSSSTVLVPLRRRATRSSLVLSFLMFAAVGFAQPKADLATPPPLDPSEGEREARMLIARLLEQRPGEAMTNKGVLKIRTADGTQKEVPTRFDIVPMSGSWINVYEATPGSGAEPVKLTIRHSNAMPNQYFLGNGHKNVNGDSKPLSSAQLMLPFAGSDFWVADLGLEFLHWPQQRVLRKQMRKGLYCDVLQSVDPKPVPGGYARVLSWIAINRPEDIIIVHAEAFDGRDRLLKEFDPKKVEKVNGVWQLEEMEIRNRQLGTRTRIDFNFGE